MTIQRLTDANAKNNREDKTIQLENKLYKAECTISELEDKINDLRNKLSSGINRDDGCYECDCDDWISAGTNPNNGDKFKQCLDCGKISIR